MSAGEPLVHVTYALPRCGLPAATSFRRWVAATLATAKLDPASEVSIRIVDTDEGRQFNARYRHKDYATNVLSFPAELPEGIDLPLLGDLVVCAPVVQHEAQAQGKPERDHWAHLTAHGILHLAGHDHIQPGEAARMEALEVKILAGLGIPDPYVARPGFG